MKQLQSLLAIVIALQLSVSNAFAVAVIPLETTGVDVAPGITDVKPEEPPPEEFPPMEEKPPLKVQAPITVMRITADTYANAGYFGDGSDGDLYIPAGQTVTLPVAVPHQSMVVMNYKNITIEAGGTLTTSAHNAGLVLKATGNVTINGIIEQSEKSPKSNPYNNYPYPSELQCGSGGNGGLGGGRGGVSRGGKAMPARAYGGGYGGGGDGRGINNPTSIIASGNYGGDSDNVTVDIPSIFIGGSGSALITGIPALAGQFGGGGGGNAGWDSENKNYDGGGNGGSGAGSNGTAGGGNENSYGGGGGAGNYGGAVVMIYCRGNLNILGNIRCNGGSGGDGGATISSGKRGRAGAGGGGGGGGSIYIRYGGSYSNSGGLEVRGGNGGIGSGIPTEQYPSGNGFSGSSGAVSVEKAPDEEMPHSITVTPSSNGTVTADKGTAWAGDIVYLTVKPDANYRLMAGSLKANGMLITGNSFTMPKANATVTASFEKIRYSVTVIQSPNGTLSVDKQTAAMGETVTVTVTPDANYRLLAGSLKVNGMLITGNSFTMPAVNTTVTASFEKSTYPVNVVQSPNGHLAVNKLDAIIGETVTITVTPNAGYRLLNGSLKVNGTPITGTSFIMPSKAATVTASFEAIIYNIYVAQPAHGALTTDKQSATIGEDVAINVSPDTGYRLLGGSLKANGKAVTDNSFIMPPKDVIITAEFEQIHYSIDTTPTAHGSVAADKATAVYGETVNLTLTIDMGYKIEPGSLRVNGVTINGNSFKMPPEDVTVTVQFAVAVFDILIAPSEWAAIITDKTSATFGEDVAVTVEPRPGYRLKPSSLKVNGIEIVDYNFIMPAGVATITAQFEPIIYNITVNDSANGSISVSKTTATIGEAVNITLAPSPGYRLVFGSLKVNGSTSGMTFIMGAENVVISAEFEAIVYNVVARSTPNGYVNVDRTTAIVGEPVNVSVFPVMGYRLKEDSLKVNGIPIVDGSFNMLPATAVISAEFEPIRYTVTVASTPNGTVSTDKTTAIIGETVKITIAPKPGYKLIEGSVKVNGRTSGTNFVMTASNAMVTAQFEPLIYTVKLVQAPNGTVTADRTEAVIGDTVKLTATPDRGYRVKANSLKVDSETINGNSFVMVAGNAAVTVEFEAIHYTIAIAKIPNGEIEANKNTAIIGEQVNLTVTADNGYKLVAGSIKANGNTVGNNFIMDAKDVTITGEFAPITYNLTIQQTPNGTVTADKSTAVLGDTVMLSVVPDSGYRLKPDSLKVNGMKISGSSFVMISANALIRAEFEPISVAGTVRDNKGVGLQGMTVSVIGDDELITATDKDGNYSFLTAPNGTYTLKADHYRWDTAQVQLVIKDGYIKDPSVLNLTCTRDDRLEVLEALIRSLPEPLEDGSNDEKIMTEAKNIQYAKTLYDELTAEIKPQLDIVLKNKLDRLLVRLAVIEGLVNSNLEGVRADGLEGVVDKNKIVSIDGEPTNKITVVLDLQTTDEPAAMDKAVIEELTGKRNHIGGYMDINLHLQVDEREPTQITETTQPVTLQMPVPPSMNGGSGYRVVRVHNGVAQYLETSIDEDNMLTFATDKFSTYAIEYIPRRGSTGGDKDDKPVPLPTPGSEPPPIAPAPYYPPAIVPIPGLPAEILPIAPMVPPWRVPDGNVQPVPSNPNLPDSLRPEQGLMQRIATLLTSPFTWLCILLLVLCAAVYLLLNRRQQRLMTSAAFKVLPAIAVEPINAEWQTGADNMDTTEDAWDSRWEDDTKDVDDNPKGYHGEYCEDECMEAEYLEDECMEGEYFEDEEIEKPECPEETEAVFAYVDPDLMLFDYDAPNDTPPDDVNDEFDDDEGEFNYED